MTVDGISAARKPYSIVREAMMNAVTVISFDTLINRKSRKGEQEGTRTAPSIIRKCEKAQDNSTSN